MEQWSRQDLFVELCRLNPGQRNYKRWDSARLLIEIAKYQQPVVPALDNVEPQQVLDNNGVVDDVLPAVPALEQDPIDRRKVDNLARFASKIAEVPVTKESWEAELNTHLLMTKYPCFRFALGKDRLEKLLDRTCLLKGDSPSPQIEPVLYDKLAKSTKDRVKRHQSIFCMAQKMHSLVGIVCGVVERNADRLSGEDVDDSLEASSNLLQLLATLTSQELDSMHNEVNTSLKHHPVATHLRLERSAARSHAELSNEVLAKIPELSRDCDTAAAAAVKLDKDVFRPRTTALHKRPGFDRASAAAASAAPAAPVAAAVPAADMNAAPRQAYPYVPRGDKRKKRGDKGRGKERGDRRGRPGGRPN